ncbi:hypothetical protein Q8A67_000116 [Cirrhinus molitorella]|uniref:Fibronectin type-III domain-containing protein n=1 Tax=Cirrhinus molitorella TaxID=172907 RepID=A0AA88TWJ7_9TELE|nr:hypothetical protein Q8A67_000116 [Cirrhinus molitorella]
MKGWLCTLLLLETFVFVVQQQIDGGLSENEISQQISNENRRQNPPQTDSLRDEASPDSQQYCHLIFSDIHTALRELTATVTEQKAEIRALETRLREELNKKTDEISALTQSQVEELRKENRDRQIAFSTSLMESGSGHVGPFTTDITLIYKNIFTNIGNAYNPITGFGDLRRPENVSVDSLNTRYVLRWDWPHKTAANQTVTFTAQYITERDLEKQSYGKYWTTVCDDILEHRCDFTRAELHYHILYVLRVRANTSQQSSGWVQIRFCPDVQAALGPPSSVKLKSVKGGLEVNITDPLSSNNQSMKTLLKNLSYLIRYWRRSEGPQTAKDLETKNNVVILTDLDRQTWYCVRVQSHENYYDKNSVFSDTHCTRTEGDMPYWQIFLYFLISLLLLCFLLVLLYFCFYKVFTSLKDTFWPAIQLPEHIQELWLGDSQKPQLLASESGESVCCEPLVIANAELDVVAVDEHSKVEDQDFSTYRRTGSGVSGVYSTEEDYCHRSTTHTDLQMSSKKHREELHDGT